MFLHQMILELDFPFSIFSFPFNMSDPSICHGISAVTNFSGICPRFSVFQLFPSIFRVSLDFPGSFPTFPWIFPGSPYLSHNFPRFGARRCGGHQLRPGGGLGHQLLRDRAAGPDQAPRHVGTTWGRDFLGSNLYFFFKFFFEDIWIIMDI